MNKFLLLTMTLMILMSTLSIAESDTVWTKEIGSEVKAVKFSPEGQFIYAAAIGRKPMKLSTETGEIIMEYEGLYFNHYQSRYCMLISEDGRNLFAADTGKYLYVWDTESGNLINKLETPYSERTGLYYRSISITNKYIAVYIIYNNPTPNDPLFKSGSILIFDKNTQQILKEIETNTVNRIEFSPTGVFLALYKTSSNNEEAEIELINSEIWNNYTIFSANKNGVTDVSFSPDGSLLASCGWDGYIKIWDVNQKKLVKEFGGNIEVNSVGFIGNDKVIGGCGTFQNRYVKIWDLTSEKFLGQIKTNIQLELDISEIKHYCVVANASSGIFLFDYLKIITGISEHKVANEDATIPNPTNNISEINFFLPISGKVLVSITDANSREIEVLFNGFLEQGEHKFQWIPKGVSNGVYFCNITSKNFSKTLKIILEK